MGLENTPVLGTSTVSAPGAVIEQKDRGIETEVLGPLRVWHIIGIVLAIVTTAVFILCCCCNFRVPRTRQQIEENYLKRKVNKRYLRLLEREAEEVLQQPGRWSRKKATGKSEISVTDTSAKIRFLNTSAKVSHPTGDAGVMRSRVAEESLDAHFSQTAGQITDYPLLPRLRAPVGVETPAPFRPRDILAMMAQQPRLREDTNVS